MLATFDVDVIAAGGGEVLKFPHRTVIHRRGDEGECAYIIKSGRVELRHRGRAVETIAPGEIFGEACLLTRAPRLAAAVALGDVEVIRIDRALFNVLLRDDQDFAMAIAMRLARRLRAMTELFEKCVDDSTTVVVAPTFRASASA
jgi:CRP-like cAMP-binding protein